VNGLGNVIIGYDENPGNQIGSHNLVLGNHQSFSTWGGIIGGAYNTLSGAASAVFGSHNNAGGSASSITGREHNIATDFYASITGGCENLAGPGNSLSGPCSPAGLDPAVTKFGTGQTSAEAPASALSPTKRRTWSMKRSGRSRGM
jgi:hypothetical protein